jgi:hypothetical protein
LSCSPGCAATRLCGDPAVRRPGCAATRLRGDPAFQRPGCAATRLCGDPAVRRPGCAATRLCGDPAVRRPGWIQVLSSTQVSLRSSAASAQFHCAAAPREPRLHTAASRDAGCWMLHAEYRSCQAHKFYCFAINKHWNSNHYLLVILNQSNPLLRRALADNQT